MSFFDSWLKLLPEILIQTQFMTQAASRNIDSDSTHDSSGFHKYWFWLNYESRGFQKCCSDSTHDSSGFQKCWFWFNSRLKQKACDSESTHDSTLSRTHVWSLSLPMLTLPASVKLNGTSCNLWEMGYSNGDCNTGTDYNPASKLTKTWMFRRVGIVFKHKQLVEFVKWYKLNKR